MKSYKLLTPGPLTTTSTVKEEMLFDHCTWDEDYKNITQKIRKELLTLAHVSPEEYTAVLMQGSGTFGVEAMMTTFIGPNDQCLIITNGAYGERIETIAKVGGLNYMTYHEAYDTIPQESIIDEILRKNTSITHVVMVHCETTTGILNDIKMVGQLCSKYSKIFLVDAMSSFGGIDIPMKDYHIDALVSSANKSIQGVPGFSFVISKLSLLKNCESQSKTLSLDLYDQWKTMDKDGKWRFTSPTHTVLAFSKALDELQAEGGINKRNKRYLENNTLLIENLKAIGFKSYIKKDWQSPIITTFLFPENNFVFEDMYHYVKNRGYAIYPGKLTDVDTFRLGNIGEIYKEDIEYLTSIFKDYMEVLDHE